MTLGPRLAGFLPGHPAVLSPLKLCFPPRIGFSLHIFLNLVPISSRAAGLEHLGPGASDLIWTFRHFLSFLHPSSGWVPPGRGAGTRGGCGRGGGDGEQKRETPLWLSEPGPAPTLRNGREDSGRCTRMFLGKVAVIVIGEWPHQTSSHPLTSHRGNQGSERAWALSQVTQRSAQAGASPGRVPWGRLHCALPSRKPLRSAARAAGEEERVWLRDWQALEAELGSSWGKTTCWGPPRRGRASGVGAPGWSPAWNRGSMPSCGLPQGRRWEEASGPAP